MMMKLGFWGGLGGALGQRAWERVCMASGKRRRVGGTILHFFERGDEARKR